MYYLNVLSLFRDGPEYIKRTQTPFKPTKVTLSEVHSIVPKHLHEKDTIKSLLYVLRDIFFAVVVYKLGWMIDPSARALVENFGLSSSAGATFKWALWALYWHTQGVMLTGLWSLAHEAGHGTLSDYRWVNHLIGYTLHTALLVPYFAFRSTHRTHHKVNASIEREQTWVPKTRSDYNLPPETSAHIADYHEVFEDAPIYSLVRIIMMQVLGFHYYMFANGLGSPTYPPGTNHFQPSSPLFKPNERKGITASNIGLTVMASILYLWTKQVGLSYFAKLFLVPYLLTNHWIVLMGFLQHSDPTIPLYRNKQWSFLRSTLSGIDRPLLGWAGRFFLHNICHDHVAHHFFPSIPFYNLPHVTKAIKEVLKDDCYYDSTNTFRALYRNFTQCCFIEDDGDIVFYKNKDGKAARVVATDTLEQPVDKSD